MPVHRKKQVDIGTWGLGSDAFTMLQASNVNRKQETTDYRSRDR